MHNCERGKFEEITRDVPLGPMIHQIDRLMFRNLSSRVRAEGLDEVTLMHGWVMRYLYENREQVICQKDIEHYSKSIILNSQVLFLTVSNHRKVWMK